MIGGGTGTFKILTGLKKYDDLKLSAIVAVTDDGGSGGKLRDEFGYLPAGDIRQCIIALSEAENGRNIMRDLFMYRFEKGGAGLEGHSFGNLFLTVMTELMEGDQKKAIDYAGKILRIKGKVIPVSLDNVEIAVEQDDGTVTVGESNIKDNYTKRNVESPIVRSWLQPKANATEEAIAAIKQADLVIIGPGGLYTSLIANLLVDGIKNAIIESKAKVLFNINLMTDNGQTHAMGAKAHVETIKNYLGKYPDFVLLNNKPFSKGVIKKYKDSDDFPVEVDLNEDEEQYKVIMDNLLPDGSEDVKQRAGFETKISVIRHDSAKIAKVIVNKILKKI